MALTLDMRVEVLEGKVRNLETWAGPGQSEAFSATLVDFKKEVNGKFAALSKDVAGLTTRVDRLQADVDELKTDVAGLKTDVDELKTDVDELKTDVASLKTDVAELRVDFVGFSNHARGQFAAIDNTLYSMRSDMATVKGTLAEILDRLPPKAA
jgi:outer membrane murein-binding lipoprotein Lpp